MPFFQRSEYCIVPGEFWRVATDNGYFPKGEHLDLENFLSLFFQKDTMLVTLIIVEKNKTKTCKQKKTSQNTVLAKASLEIYFCAQFE